MAQSPDKPKDNGKVGLPRTDNAMNKTAPKSTGGGKGSARDKDNITLGANEDRGKKRDHRKLLERARKRFDQSASAEADNRKDALDDLKFYSGGMNQWPSDVVKDRTLNQRPCLTINKLPTFVKQVTNDIRQNRPAINVSPVGDKSDPEVAKMYAGLIRFIERESSADIAYDTASESAVRCGFGYWRILTEYESPDDFDQTIVIQRIPNPFTVYLDPASNEPDGADARFAFVSEMMPRSEFEDKYPDADPMAFPQSGVGDTLKSWITKDEVRIAEYFEVKTEKKTLVALSNGHIGWKDELSEDVMAMIDREDITVENERESELPTVKWYKMTGTEVLEENDWLGTSVPIIKVIGDEVNIEGKTKLAGVIRHAKDPQRMFNYWRSLQTEKVALAPKAKWVMEEGQLEGHEAEWKTANTRNVPVLTYKATSVEGTLAPPPNRIGPEPLDASVENALQGSSQDMMATTGIRFDATLQERMMDESGKAIRELRRSGDIGSFNYIDNLSRSLKRCGRMLVEIIPKVYDTKRIVTILREDDGEERVQIDPAAAKPFQEMKPQPTPQNKNPKTLKIFNPTYGKYGVTVTIGPSFATKRIEASESMVAFAKAVPQIAPMIADLIAKNQDWPGADQIAARIAKTLPPNLLTPDQKDVPPQIQALIQSMSQHIQQMGQERMQMIAALNEKQSDRAQRQDEIDKAFMAKMAALEEKYSEALLKVSAKSVDQGAGHAQSIEAEVLKAFLDTLKSATDSAPVSKVSEDVGKVSGGLEKLAESLATSHKELMGSHQEMMGTMGRLIDAHSKPRRIVPKRNKDGDIEEMMSEPMGSA